ncbi:26S proteasome non-ATPase regulatory subunit 13-like protein, partial [Trifolium pratense]
MAALQYLESLRSSHPGLGDWSNSVADLYQKKLWHQLTHKLEEFLAFQMLWHLVEHPDTDVTASGRTFGLHFNNL